MLNTPLKRVGFILLLSPIFSILILALYWNLFFKTFFYSTSEQLYDQANIEWYFTSDEKDKLPVNKACLLKKSGASSLYDLGAGTRLKMATECLLSPTATKTQWETSIWDFLKYFRNNIIFKISCLMPALGIIFISGLFSKVLIWIKSGNTQKIQSSQLPKNSTPKWKFSKITNISNAGKIIGGIVMCAIWVLTYAIGLHLGIKLGAIPTMILVLAWFWVFSHVTGIRFNKRH